MINKLTILIISMLWSFSGVSQQPGGNKGKNLETVLKFAGCVNWAEDSQKNDLLIFIADDDEERFNAATAYLANRDFKNRKIQTVKLNDETELNTSCIVFITQNTGIDVDKLIAKTSGKHVMTITTNQSLLEKGCMFYINAAENEELEYLFNKRAVLDSELTINSLLFDPAHKWKPTEY
ncbi:MAG: YfiR family protein [Bacteroidales bacterium]|nr:YfiR family protein [Bacteroidales bacterium]